MPESVVAVTLVEKLEAARAASLGLATLTADRKNQALEAIALAVETNAARILPANDLDLANARENGVSAALQDRLRLDEVRLAVLSGHRGFSHV